MTLCWTRKLSLILKILQAFEQWGDPRCHSRHNRNSLRLHLGTISLDAVKHLLLCWIERRPPRLDLMQYPHLPLPQVATTQAADYMALLGGGASMSAADSSPAAPNDTPQVLLEHHLKLLRPPTFLREYDKVVYNLRIITPPAASKSLVPGYKKPKSSISVRFSLAFGLRQLTVL